MKQKAKLSERQERLAFMVLVKHGIEISALETPTAILLEELCEFLLQQLPEPMYPYADIDGGITYESNSIDGYFKAVIETHPKYPDRRGLMFVQTKEEIEDFTEALAFITLTASFLVQKLSAG